MASSDDAKLNWGVPGIERPGSIATKEIILRLLDDFENSSK